MVIFLNKIRRKIGNILYKPLPLNPKDDDIYIVSFPRSGNTWVRFFLANLIKYDKGELLDFNRLEDIIPDLHKNKNVDNKYSFKEIPRIMKSHSKFIKEYKRVIYIVRNPKDVMVSYFYYTRYGLLNKEIESFENFVKDKKKGILAWKEHVNSWEGKTGVIIRYEDLLENAYTNFKLICDYIGIPDYCYKNIKGAIEKSSFDTMSKIEEKKGMPYLKNNEFRFIREGRSEIWKDYFSPSLNNWVNSNIKKELELFKYNRK